MSYKISRGKKSPKTQKQKCAHIISSDLIEKKRFQEIINVCNQSKQSELTHRDQYLYGYALLQSQKEIEALIILWPLAGKGYATLQEDCALIAAHVFKDDDFLKSTLLSEEDLYILFTAAKMLAPESTAYDALKQRLFNTHWQKGDYEKCERIIKSLKKEPSGVTVENLSKLAFFQPEKKLIGNPAAFVSHILTGGACLILKNPMYHHDIAEEIYSLANEIKIIFTHVKSKNNKNGLGDATTFENFVDTEAGILSQVLRLAVKNNALHCDIIPTPSYLAIYDVTSKQVSQKFLPWLASADQSLFEIYDPDIYHAALCAINGDKLSVINNLLKSSNKNKFHPYLRLALMLRATNMKQSSFAHIVQLSDFNDLKEPDSFFKTVAIQAIKSILNTQVTAEFWEKMIEFYPTLEVPEFKNKIIAYSIDLLHQQYKSGVNLNLEGLRIIAHRLNANELEQHCDILCTRQQACLTFLSNLDEKKSKKIMISIKDESALRDHLVLLFDTYYFFSKLPDIFHAHLRWLVENKRINKLLPLEDLFDCNFHFEYIMGARNLRTIVSSVSKKLNLSVAALPDVNLYLTQMTYAKTRTESILSQTDPFKILDVSYTDSKQMIMQKVMILIQQFPEKMAMFRKAQSELFHPVHRFLHHYLRALSFEDQNIEDTYTQVSSPAHPVLHKIPLRHEFLHAN